MIPRIPQGWRRQLNKNLDCSMLLLQAELDSLETQKRQFIYITIAGVCLSVRSSTFSSTPSHGPISNLSPFLESSCQVGGNKIIWGPIGA